MEANLLRASMRASGRAAAVAVGRGRRLWVRLWAGRRFRRALAVLVALALALFGGYAFMALSIAAELVRIERRLPGKTPAAIGLQFEDVRFRSQDGLLLHGWLVQPQGPREKRRLVILLQDVGDRRDDPAILELSAGLADAGFATLVFDGRGAGASEGQHYTLGYGERYDLLGALEFSRARGYAAERIGALGRGTGGATALLTAAETAEIAALAVDSSYASLRDQLRFSLQQRRLPVALEWGVRHAVRLRYGPDIRYILPEAAVARMAPRPLLVIHGEYDRQVPADHARRLAEAAAPGTAELWIVPRAGHLQGLSRQRGQYLHRVISFFARTVGKEDHE